MNIHHRIARVVIAAALGSGALYLASYGVVRFSRRVVHAYPCMSLTSQTHRMRWAPETPPVVEAAYMPAMALELLAHVGMSSLMGTRYCG